MAASKVFGHATVGIDDDGFPYVQTSYGTVKPEVFEMKIAEKMAQLCETSLKLRPDAVTVACPGTLSLGISARLVLADAVTIADGFLFSVGITTNLSCLRWVRSKYDT